MSPFHDLTFSSADGADFGAAVDAAASANIAEWDNDGGDAATISAASSSLSDDATTATTASDTDYSAAAAASDSEHELGEFLWDALASFDSTLPDFEIETLCPA